MAKRSKGWAPFLWSDIAQFILQRPTRKGRQSSLDRALDGIGRKTEATRSPRFSGRGHAFGNAWCR